MGISFQRSDAFGYHTCDQLVNKVLNMKNNTDKAKNERIDKKINMFMDAKNNPKNNPEIIQKIKSEIIYLYGNSEEIERKIDKRIDEKICSLNSSRPYVEKNSHRLITDMIYLKNTVKNLNLVKNIITIAGCIPIIGTIIAIAKLILISYTEKVLEKKDKDLKKELQGYLDGQKIRSRIELTSLGFLLAIPDLIFTIGRHISKKTAEAV